MEPTDKILESSSLIRFPDCDPFGHLNNSRYIDYFINAREDQLLQNYGLDVYHAANDKGLSWVVAQNQIVYLKPALLMEKVVIQSQLIDYGQRFVTAEMRMYNQNKSTLKSLLWVKFVHFNIRNQKSEIHSEEFMDLFEKVVAPLEEKTFEERIAVLRKQSAATLG